MRRREFITLLGGAAVASPLPSRAQQGGRLRRIGILEGGENSEAAALLAGFRSVLKDLGWVSGYNVRFDERWAEGDVARMRLHAADLVKQKPDVILVNGVPAAAALLQETRTIPLVMSIGSDPVAAGFVSSIARPGGNFTGFVNFEYSMAGKWLEVLREIAPHLRRVAILHNPENPTWPGQLKALEKVAGSLALQLTLIGVHDAAEITKGIDALGNATSTGLLVLPLIVNSVHRELILALARTHRLPAIYPYRFFTSAGGLVSYGIDVSDLYRRAATYVHRILNGEKVGELPIQVPTKFELVVNLKTAKSLGLELPATLLARADEVIE